MNNLSWLLYLADVCDSFKGIVTGLLVLSCCGAVFLGVAILVLLVEESTEKGWAIWRLTLKYVIGLFLFSSISMVLIPQKSTVYAIAASEVGEKVIESPTAKKAVDALNRWLDQQKVNTQ